MPFLISRCCLGQGASASLGSRPEKGALSSSHRGTFEINQSISRPALRRISSGDFHHRAGFHDLFFQRRRASLVQLKASHPFLMMPLLRSLSAERSRVGVSESEKCHSTRQTQSAEETQTHRTAKNEREVSAGAVISRCASDISGED